MNKTEAQLKIESLKIKIRKWNTEYYDKDSPTVDDAVYDKAIKELINIEKKFPELITADSPSQKVGGSVSNQFTKVKHSRPMLSLANAFDSEDLRKFDSQIKNQVNKEKIEYVVEPKVDGLSISLHYKNGKFIRAVTRGDGEVGEDVTNNILMISSIPTEIEDKTIEEVRGEVYMNRSDFDFINQRREANEESTFANPRNAAAGALRQKNSYLSSRRNLQALLYQVFPVQNRTLTSDYESLKENGFHSVIDYLESYTDIGGVIEYTDSIQEKRQDKYLFEIDGLVNKVNDRKLHEDIGYTSKAPKWAIAYKFKAEVKETKMKNIFGTVGRTGRITYNAELEPITISGSVVSAATLHNFDYISDNDLRIGDIVRVKKAGEIIPKVIDSVIELRDGTEPVFEKLTNCPKCNSVLVKQPGEVDQYCLNQDCKARRLASIIHFASRNALNIEGLGEKLIERLFESDLLKDIADIFDLKNHKDDLVKLEKLGDKSISNLLTSIEKSKLASFEKVLFGLGIKYVGEKVATELAKIYPNIKEFKLENLDKILTINGIGPKVIESIRDWLSIYENIKLIQRLIDAGLSMVTTGLVQVKDDAKLVGFKFVITGTLSKPRSEFEDILTMHGAQISTSISKQTNYLLCGNDAGSKLEKAKKLGVKILSEDDLFEMIG